jgi:hypothetical protein
MKKFVLSMVLIFTAAAQGAVAKSKPNKTDLYREQLLWNFKSKSVGFDYDFRDYFQEIFFDQMDLSRDSSFEAMKINFSRGDEIYTMTIPAVRKIDAQNVLVECPVTVTYFGPQQDDPHLFIDDCDIFVLDSRGRIALDDQRNKIRDPIEKGEPQNLFFPWPKKPTDDFQSKNVLVSD